MTQHLHLFDYIVIAIYLLGVMGIGLWMSARQKTAADYFIAGRRVPGWAVAFTLMATIISSASFVGHPGAVFAKSFYLLPAHVGLPLILLFAVYFIVPFYRRVVGMSSYEYFGYRFGTGARLYTSLGFVVMRTIDLGVTLYTASIATEVMTGWSITGVVVWIGLMTTIYTMIGGIEGVVWTDVVQGFVLMGGMLLILAILLFQPHAGPLTILSVANEGGKFNVGNLDWSWGSLFNPEATVWIWLAAGLMIQGRGYTVDQNIVQRYLLARTDREAQRGVLAGAMLCLPIWMTFMLIGACLWSFYQSPGVSLPPEVIAQPDTILPYFVVTQLPAGVVGLILAAILAAAQSSVSADLNSIATVITSDYLGHFFPQSSDRTRMRFGRSIVLITGLIVTAIAFLLSKNRAASAIEVGQTLVTIVAGGVLGLFALGFFTRRATRNGAYTGIVCCIVFTGWATMTGPLGIDLGLNFTGNHLLIGILSQFVLFTFGYGASLIFAHGPSEVAGLTVWDLAARARAEK